MRNKVLAIFVMALMILTIFTIVPTVKAANITIAGANIQSGILQSGSPSYLYDGYLNTWVQFKDSGDGYVSVHWDSQK